MNVRIDMYFKQKGNRSLLAKISRVPKAMRKAKDRYARLMKRLVIQEARRHGHYGVSGGSKSLIGGIKADVRKNTAQVLIPLQGFYLGSMRDHYVKLKHQRRGLIKWVKAKFTGTFIRSGKSRINLGGIRPTGVLYVKRSKYLEVALNKAKNQTGKILREELKRVMKT